MGVVRTAEFARTDRLVTIFEPSRWISFALFAVFCPNALAAPQCSGCRTVAKPRCQPAPVFKTAVGLDFDRPKRRLSLGHLQPASQLARRFRSQVGDREALAQDSRLRTHCDRAFPSGSDRVRPLVPCSCLPGCCCASKLARTSFLAVALRSVGPWWRGSQTSKRATHLLVPTCCLSSEQWNETLFGWSES